MANITIITDSASDISQNNNKGVTVLPMTITFGRRCISDNKCDR